MATKTQAINAVLNRLRSALGTGETPPGSNSNFIVDWYNAHVDRIGNGPWCEMTNTWCMWTGGAKSLKKGRAYTVWAAEDGENHVNSSSWHWGTAGIEPGDQVYYDWGGAKGDVGRVDHTGTVERVNGDGTFYVLEGNHSNKLQRVLRDSKYVVGYVRFNWDSLADEPAPNPPVKQHPKPDRELTAQLQSVLEVTPDGYWGPKTDGRALLMRAASRAHVGWPSNVPANFDVRIVQLVINTTVDGIWGPHSQAALVVWVKKCQRALRVPDDGQWGPQTDNAFLVARKQNVNNY